MKTKTPGHKLIKIVLQELRLLRHDFSLLIPSENLSDFKIKTKIVSSYKKALKQFPPSIQ